MGWDETGMMLLDVGGDETGMMLLGVGISMLR